MSIKVCVLASGSKGNCTLVATDECNILVDCGISCKQLESRLLEIGHGLGMIDAIVVTHSHTDHVSGLETVIKKYGIRVIAPKIVVDGIIRGCKKICTSKLLAIEPSDFFIKDITVSPFAVPHDVPCFGYSFYSGGAKATVITDVGQLKKTVVDDVKDSDIIVLESNHDVDMLWANRQYTYMLKKRISGNHGHLSNDDCSDAVLEFARSKVRQIILAHLSEQNNAPSRALECVRMKLEGAGFACGRDIGVDVACQHAVSRVFEIK